MFSFVVFIYRAFIVLNTMGRYTGKKCRLLCMIALTASFMIIELVVGYVTNSMALVADSFHMLSDVVSIVIAFISVKVTLFASSNSNCRHIS